MEELLDIKELARLLHVSTRLIWGMRDAGKLPQPVKLNRLCRWRASQIQEWIRQGCPSCRPSPAGPRSTIKGGRP